ncbi:hypothetical protein Ade02nite_69380 [Paractinoplanes deccanensis]|uniref:YbjN domain-containing protein n=1 Tax=Paractinoplanes deccanensis TaxID=113561 RepID=A0ABQ3YE85_9ACTN|nr:hypothetical protein [Actinoplanes deccanensis]GID78297.1 hypothetical protein Ade02nite_69380 [Actinoplanes deccanensis]
MTDDVELFVSSRLRPDEVAGIRAELRDWGWEPQVLRMPARRGAAEFTWLLLLTVPAEIFVKTVLEQLGKQAYESLRGFVQRHLGREATGDGKQVVVIEEAGTGAQFGLTADLPLAAYQQMVEALATGAVEDGFRTFDRKRGRWTADSET